MSEPYAFGNGEGRAYKAHGVVFTMKASGAETRGGLSMWEIVTRPGEEPRTHVHADEDEIFYVLSGSMTVRCGERSFDIGAHGFVFLPRGIPHGYTITSDEVRVLGLTTPSGFGDDIERRGTRVEP